jgi:hypothetical protein
MSDYMSDLEKLIDAYGLSDVIHCLERICDAKAEHVATNWQDTRLAKAWAGNAHELEKMRYKIHPVV